MGFNLRISNKKGDAAVLYLCVRLQLKQ